MQENEYEAPRAPRGLGDEGQRLWRTVTREWELEPDSEELELLRMACKAADRLDRAQCELDKAGSLTFTDRFDRPCERPELGVIRRERQAVASLVKQIGEAQLRFRRLELAEDRAAQSQDRGNKPRSGGGRRYY